MYPSVCAEQNDPYLSKYCDFRGQAGSLGKVISSLKVTHVSILKQRNQCLAILSYFKKSLGKPYHPNVGYYFLALTLIIINIF